MKVYDQMMQMCADPEIDPRLLIVAPKVFRRDINTGAVIIQVESETNEQIWQYWWELAETTEAFARVLDKMAYIDFTQRYHSASEVLNTLENL